MIKLGQFNKAEELYDILLKQATNEGEKAYLFHDLGLIINNQGKYTEAADFYEKLVKINQKILPPTHVVLATSYSNIGRVYYYIDSLVKRSIKELKKTICVQKNESFGF
jgi:tetratricopeptide (TPR) repeat protein